MPQIPKTTSLRPEFLVSTDPQRVVDAQTGAPSTDVTQMQATIGVYGAGAFGRGRMLTALPTNGSGPVMVWPPMVIASPLSYLVDPDGYFVGERAAGFVHRLLTARWVEDTRRLGG